MELKLFSLIAAVFVIASVSVWLVVKQLRGAKHGWRYPLLGGLIALFIGYALPSNDVGFLALNIEGASHLVELSYKEVRAIIGLAIGMVAGQVASVAMMSKGRA